MAIFVKMQNFNLKKFFLYLLIASVALSALLGIIVILFGNFGEFETKILVTTFTITCMSILGLACGAYLETERGKILPFGGIALAILSAILWIFFIWYDGKDNENIFVRFAFSTTLLASSCSLVSLLSIAKLDRKFLWSRYAAHVATWSLAAILLWIIWFDTDRLPDFMSRVIGVLSILVAALTIVTPIFHWLSRQKNETEDIDAEIARLRARIEELENQKAQLTG